MRSVLFIAYHFPPVGGGGVQRSAKMVRYLRDHGYQSIVVTGTGMSSDRWAPSDETLNAEVPRGTKVHRASGPEPRGSGKSRAKVERRLMLTPPTVAWWIDQAEALGLQYGSRADLVYASLIPYRTADAAVRIARRLEKPLVLDLQDPWALDEMWIYPTALHRRLDLRRMRLSLEAAEAVVMNTPEACERVLRHFPSLRERLVVSIPNGFDGADFERHPSPRSDGKFRIVHTGYLHTEQGIRLRRTAPLRRILGGTYERVDILTRSHIFLLEAIDSLIERDPDLAGIIEVHLAGSLTKADLATAERSTVTRVQGYLSHPETVQLIQSADLLFLPMHDLPPGVRAGLVPGKTYEYLASGRPILAAVPEGDARDILTEAGNAFVCSPSDSAAMAAIIARQIRCWKSGGSPAGPQPNVVSRYERRRQAAELAQLFDRVLGNPVGDPPPGPSIATQPAEAV